MLRHGQLLFWLCFFFSRALLAHGQEGDDQEGPHDPEPETQDHGINQDALSSDQMHAVHSKMDANGDGGVSMVEVLDFARRQRHGIAKKDVSTIVDEMDTDRNGKLSLEELLRDLMVWAEDGEQSTDSNAEAESRKALEIQKFQLADRNADGVLDMEELPAVFYPETSDDVLAVAAAHTHKKKDTDGDGKLSSQEFWEGDGVDGEHLAISEFEDKDFAKLDKDGDGSLSVDELKYWESGAFHLQDAMHKLFEVADENQDMHVSADELDKARERLASTDAHYHLVEWVEHHEL